VWRLTETARAANPNPNPNPAQKVFREVRRTAELAAQLEETRRLLTRAEAAANKDRRCHPQGTETV
jgi:hypothetical protein